MLKISINMIIDTLAEYHPECFYSGETVSFSGLRLYERSTGQLSPENIYMCASRELDRFALNSNCYFLCVNKMSSALRSHCLGKRVVVIEDESVHLATVFNTIQSLFTDMREWHQNMHVSLIQNNNVQELLNMSEAVLGNPIVLVDLGFKLLAHTEHIQTDDEVYNELIRRGYHTKQNIDRLTRTRQVESIKNLNSIDTEQSLPQVSRYPIMTKTFYQNGVPCAYMRMICSSKPPTRSMKERFALLAESVEYYLHNYYSEASLHKNIYEYVLVELIEKRIVDQEHIADRVSAAGLEMDAEYLLGRVVFEDEANISLSYMLDQILSIFPEARPFLYNGSIIMLMDYDGRLRSDQSWKAHRFQAVQDFLVHYRANCGISAVFHSPLLVADAYVQTAVAIDLGRQLQEKWDKTDGKQRMFSYSEYFVYHLITACSRDVQLKSLCDEKLLRIWMKDQQKNTKSTELLYTYLINNCRPTDTGAVLHMHRNNVIYHIERLSEQFDLDLKDPETRLRLLISFKILDLLKHDSVQSSQEI